MNNFTGLANSTEEIKKAIDSFSSTDGIGLIDTPVLNPQYRDLCNRTFDPYAGVFGRNLAESLARRDLGFLSPFSIGITTKDVSDLESMVQTKPNMRTISEVVEELDDTIRDVTETIPLVLTSSIVALPAETATELRDYRAGLLRVRDVLASRAIVRDNATEYLTKFLVSLRTLVINGNSSSSERRKLDSTIEREQKKKKPLIADEALFAAGLKIIFEGGKCTIFTRDKDMLRIMQKAILYFHKYHPALAERFDEGDLVVCHANEDQLSHYVPANFGLNSLKKRRFSEHAETYRKRSLTAAYRALTEGAKTKFLESLKDN